MSRAPETETALDPEAVLQLLADAVEEWAGFQPRACRVRELKRTPRRIVARYDLSDGDRSAAVVGKWFSTDRGAVVADASEYLRAHGFGGPDVAVPKPLAYVDEHRVLFTEVVDGPLLRELLRENQEVCARAGEWLASFHGSGLTSPRSCGPAKQRRATARWASEAGGLQELAPPLDEALSSLPDPRRPVHYDYYHSQIVATENGPTVSLDLDEAGLGDPAFDLAHFDAHLELLALEWTGDPASFAAAQRAFERGYAAVAPPPPRRAALAAFAWFKLAHQLVRRRAPVEHRDYALDKVRASLSAA
jgi:hypothetical protein